MSSVNSNASNFSYSPQSLMKALDVDKKGYVTQDDISNYRGNNKLSKNATSFLDALSDEDVFSQVSDDRTGNGKIIVEQFEWLASRGGNYNKIDNADMTALKQGIVDRKKSEDEQQQQIERRQALNASYKPKDIMNTLDRDKDGFITPKEEKRFTETHTLSKGASRVLATIRSAFEAMLSLPVQRG